MYINLEFLVSLEKIVPHILYNTGGPVTFYVIFKKL